MATDLGAIAEQLFEGVMAPMVLGGTLRPGHVIGARTALMLGKGARRTTNVDLESRTQLGRVRRARSIVPIDRLEFASPSEWALAAALHDIFQAVNPAFDAVLRRRSTATRILALAGEAIERVRMPADVREALSRHTWFARLFDAVRNDTTLSWWSGSQTFLGVDPPARLKAWPELRRVKSATTPRPLLEVTPLAFPRDALRAALAQLLERTPITDIGTCTRSGLPFVWSRATLAVVASRAGRTLVTRALARLPSREVDIALGRATRTLLTENRAAAAPAVTLLGERALARAEELRARRDEKISNDQDGAFAQGLGAVAATLMLEGAGAGWADDDRAMLAAMLESAARSPAAREAAALLQPSA